jgi:hypothetical protein
MAYPTTCEPAARYTQDAGAGGGDFKHRRGLTGPKGTTNWPDSLMSVDPTPAAYAKDLAETRRQVTSDSNRPATECGGC